MGMEMILVYTTFPDMETARRIVGELVKKRIIACANLREHDALYIENGDVVEREEIGALIKTEVGKWKELKEEIRRMHPYKTPLLMRIDVDRVNHEYIEWMEKVLG